MPFCTNFFGSNVPGTTQELAKMVIAQNIVPMPIIELKTNKYDHASLFFQVRLRKNGVTVSA